LARGDEMQGVLNIKDEENILVISSKNNDKEKYENTLKHLENEKNRVALLENEIQRVQNDHLKLENELELQLLVNIETIVKQEEFILELNKKLLDIKFKNEQYENKIIQEKQRFQKLEKRYMKLKNSKFGKLAMNYWSLRKNLKIGESIDRIYRGTTK
jgi:hypothetical protein